MERKVLATGAGGMVGAYLPPDVIRTDLPELDVADRAAVDAAIEEHRPDVVLHLAAETNVDRAEQQPDRAYLINAIGTQNVALACARHGAELVYVSSAQVFDGEKHDPYHEFDDVGPRTVYGRSKLAGEGFVRRLVPRHYVVRAGWMIGGGPSGEKKFIAKMLDHAERQGKIVAVDDKFGSPTRAQDLVGAVWASWVVMGVLSWVRGVDPPRHRGVTRVPGRSVWAASRCRDRQRCGRLGPTSRDARVLWGR